jgi:hypothetical protein
VYAVGNQALIRSLEIVDAQKQTNAARELPADGAHLLLAVGTRKQDARLASDGPNDDPSLGTPVIGERRCVFH